MKEKFKEYRPKTDTLALIDFCNKIIAEYQAQGFTLTLRQLYYQPRKDGVQRGASRSQARGARLGGRKEMVTDVADRTGGETVDTAKLRGLLEKATLGKLLTVAGDEYRPHSIYTLAYGALAEMFGDYACVYAELFTTAVNSLPALLKSVEDGQRMREAAKTLPPHVFHAADIARNAALRDDPNDQITALADAIQAAILALLPQPPATEGR